MTRLRKMTLEELERRNYSEATTRCYIRTVEDFTRRFKRSPDCLGPEHIREYQAELFRKRKLSPGTVTQRLRRITSTHLYVTPPLHSICMGPASAAIAGGSLQVVVSKARKHATPRIHLASSRFRYNTRTSRYSSSEPCLRKGGPVPGWRPSNANSTPAL